MLVISFTAFSKTIKKNKVNDNRSHMVIFFKK